MIKGRVLFFWVGFPISLLAMFLAWIVYKFEHPNNNFSFTDLKEAFKHFYLGKEE